MLLLNYYNKLKSIEQTFLVHRDLIDFQLHTNVTKLLQINKYYSSIYYKFQSDLSQIAMEKNFNKRIIILVPLTIPSSGKSISFKRLLNNE